MSKANAIFTGKRIVTKHNKGQFPQYPVGTTLFMLISDMKTEDNPDGDFVNVVLDRNTLKAKMKSGQISVTQLKLDKLDRIIVQFPDVRYSHYCGLANHIRYQIKSGVYVIDTYELDKNVDFCHWVDGETTEFIQKYRSYYAEDLFDIVNEVVQELKDKGHKVYSYSFKISKTGYRRAFYSCSLDLITKKMFGS